MRALKQMLNMFNLVLLSSIVAVMFVIGFTGENIKILFVKIRDYKIPYQTLESIYIRFKFDKKLTY